MMNFTCNICRQNVAEKTSTIFLDNKLSAVYFLVVVSVVKTTESFIDIPTCAGCHKKVRRENHFNKTGSAWIAAAFFGIIIGLLMIGIEVPAILSGDMSSLFHTPVVGVIFLVPSIFMIWRCYKARKQIGRFLESVGYQHKGRMGVKLF